MQLRSFTELRDDLLKLFKHRGNSVDVQFMYDYRNHEVSLVVEYWEREERRVQAEWYKVYQWDLNTKGWDLVFINEALADKSVIVHVNAVLEHTKLL